MGAFGSVLSSGDAPEGGNEIVIAMHAVLP